MQQAMKDRKTPEPVWNDLDTFATPALHLHLANQSRTIPSQNATLPLCRLAHGSAIVRERLFWRWSRLHARSRFNVSFYSSAAKTDGCVDLLHCVFIS